MGSGFPSSPLRPAHQQPAVAPATEARQAAKGACHRLFYRLERFPFKRLAAQMVEQPAVAVVLLLLGAQHRQLGQAGEITDAVNGLDDDRPADDLRPSRQGHAHMVFWIMKVLKL